MGTRSSFQEWPLKCPSCGCVEKKYKWSDDTEPAKCSSCGEETRIDFDAFPNETPFVIGGKFKKGRTKQDATSRRLNDFKDSVFPTLPAWEKRHFAKKHGWAM